MSDPNLLLNGTQFRGAALKITFFTAPNQSLWREHFSNLRCYELTTLSYDTATAPFLAMRPIQLAHDCAQKFPNIAQIMLDNVYIGDILSSDDSEPKFCK